MERSQTIYKSGDLLFTVSIMGSPLLFMHYVKANEVAIRAYSANLFPITDGQFNIGAHP